MERYDYLEAVTNDVRDYISNEIDFKDFDSLDDLREFLNDELWVNDSVTGNGSGSYTCNAYYAEEYLCHNWDLLAEAFNEFGCEIGYEFGRGPESCDVTIRCYLLGQAIEKALEEIEDDFDEAHYDNDCDPDGRRAETFWDYGRHFD